MSDANWKLSVDVPVSLLKRPTPQDIKSNDLSVNIADKWKRLEKEIIATGICKEMKAPNPYSEERPIQGLFHGLDHHQESEM